jgi:hypothetical protein
MEPETIKNAIDGILGDYALYFFGAAAALFFKGAIENFVSGLMFYYGSDYNVDDEVYIRGVTKARIVRQTYTKTVFYLSKTNRRLIVQNNGLNMMQIEKVLPAESDNTE